MGVKLSVPSERNDAAGGGVQFEFPDALEGPGRDDPLVTVRIQSKEESSPVRRISISQPPSETSSLHNGKRESLSFGLDDTANDIPFCTAPGDDVQPCKTGGDALALDDRVLLENASSPTKAKLRPSLSAGAHVGFGRTEREGHGSDFREAYKVGMTLGKGAFSTVKLATRRDNGKKYAVKIMKHGPDGSVTMDNIRREIELLQASQHPGVIELVEYFEEERKAYLVMELLEGGELLAALADVGAYTEEDAQSCFLRLLRVLKFIHSRGIIHRDLKLENLVMSQDGARVDSIKLIDFGMAKYAAEPEKEQTVIGTPLYVSPEILVAASKDGNCKNPYSYANDMWSVGVILHILLVGFPPFYGEHEPTLFENIKKANYSFDDPAWEMVSDEAKDLVSKLLVVDPRNRMSAVDALKHPWCCSQRPQSSLDSVGPNVKKNMLTERLKSVAKSIVSKIRRISATTSKEGSPIFGSALNSRRNSIEAKTQPRWSEGGSAAASGAASFSAGVSAARLADKLSFTGGRDLWARRPSEPESRDPQGIHTDPQPLPWVEFTKRRASRTGDPSTPRLPSILRVPSRRRSVEIAMAGETSTSDERQVRPESRSAGVL